MSLFQEIIADKIKRRTILGRAACLALFLLGLVLVYRALDFCVNDDVTRRTRLVLHDFYEEEHLDSVFAGSSHLGRAINAVAISESLGEETFNLGTTDQELRGSYYLIKEAIEVKGVKHVYLEVSIAKLTEKGGNETANFILSDYIRSLPNKVGLITDVFDSDHFVNAFLTLRRGFDPQKVPSLGKLYQTYREKRGETYRTYKPFSPYLGKGQFNTREKLGNKAVAIYTNASSLDLVSPEDIREDNLDTLRDVITLCKKHGVDLTFIFCPYFEYYLMRLEDYDGIVGVVKDLAAENGVDVIDLNLVRDEYLSLALNEFQNLDHVNRVGADKVSDFIATYSKDPEGDYFYDSLSEKYPERDGILWLGFDRKYVSDRGEYSKLRQVKGTLKGMQVDVTGISYREVPTVARLWFATKDEETGEWVNGEEIEGEQLDACTTRFMLKDTTKKTYYRAQLVDPETGEVLYEMITKFSMI